MRPIVFLLASASIAFSGLGHAQAANPSTTAVPPQAPTTAAWFARVNGVELSAAYYDDEAREAFRTKFYHGTPPESELNQMLRSVGDMLIDRVLLKQEVDVRKISADAAEVKTEIEKIERRYSASPGWAQQREMVLPNLQRYYEDKSRVRLLEQAVRSAPVTDDEVRAYYDKNPAIFTEPAKTRLSIILFRVDPSSPWAEWEKAQKHGEETKAEILAGADFGQLAKERSRDPSAANGGDLGYLHEGMLAPAIESELVNLKPGEVGGPTRILEGVAVFRLVDRTPPQLYDFASSEKRARERIQRTKSDEAWQGFLESLRKAAKIEIGPAFVAVMQPPKPANTAAQ